MRTAAVVGDEREETYGAARGSTGRRDDLDTDIAELDTAIEAMITPFAHAVTRLDEIPGIGAVAASAIIAEIGLDMTRFPPPATSPPVA